MPGLCRAVSVVTTWLILSMNRTLIVDLYYRKSLKGNSSEAKKVKKVKISQ